MNEIKCCAQDETICVRAASFDRSKEMAALWIYAAVGCLALGLAHAAQTKPDDNASAEPVYELGPGINPPRVTRQVNPQYSGTRGVRIVGTVTIGLVVTSRGLPQDPHVLKSLDKDIDASAVEAVKQWRFDPAKKDGKAVAVRIALEIEFHSM
jgi:TonB family protein